MKVPVPVSEWSDDKTLSTANKLILVVEGDICDCYVGAVQVLTEVYTTLTQPVKIRGRAHIVPKLSKEEDSEQFY